MKKIIGIAISVLMATLFCVTAFAVEPRWKNVIAISPTIDEHGVVDRISVELGHDGQIAHIPNNEKFVEYSRITAQF